MGVMGGVRRRCDTVTAFMFLPKDPSSDVSDPFLATVMQEIGRNNAHPAKDLF